MSGDPKNLDLIRSPASAQDEERSRVGHEAEESPKVELPGYYECKTCFAIRPIRDSYTCPGCLNRNCTACRCGEKKTPPCPTGSLSYEDYDRLPAGPHIIEETKEWMITEIAIRIEGENVNDRPVYPNGQTKIEGWFDEPTFNN